MKGLNTKFYIAFAAVAFLMGTTAPSQAEGMFTEPCHKVCEGIMEKVKERSKKVAEGTAAAAALAGPEAAATLGLDEAGVAVVGALSEAGAWIGGGFKLLHCLKAAVEAEEKKPGTIPGCKRHHIL